MSTNFVLATVVSLALIGVATPAHAQRGGGARSGGGQVARGAVSTGRAVPRVAPRVVYGSHGYYGSPYRYYSQPYYAYSQPYYAFRPHVSVGFGLWVGYPVPYPYYYGNYYRAPYPYPYPYGYSYPYPAAAYGYPAPAYAYPAPNPSSPYPGAYPPAGAVTVQPPTTTGAGVSFEITPVDADVFVDGTYVGRVSNFGPRSQPLSVTPGRHLIEIRRQGYQTLSFDADVAAGQVIPYEGAMQPLVR